MDALELAFLDQGPREAPVVVLLHGFPDSSALWRAQAATLVAAGFRVVVPDLRGFGDSPAPAATDAYALPLLMADVLALLDRLGVGEAVLVGHDWGAALGWVLAAYHPARFTRFCAVSVGHPSLLWDLSLTGVEQMERSWYVWLFQFEDAAEALLTRDGWALFRAWARHHPECPRQIAQLSRPGRLFAALAWYRANSRPRAFAEGGFSLPRLQVPVLTVWGESDPYVGEVALRDAHRLVDAPCTHVRLPAGHWPMLDAPQQVSALLCDFAAGRLPG